MKYETDSAYDNLYLCMDGINKASWGYNNLQWYGGTYYHKFNEDWHISMESYVTHQHKVLNTGDLHANGTTDGNTTAMGNLNIMGFEWNNPYNAPFGAKCKSVTQLWCTTTEATALFYLNYRISGLDNLSWRAEFVDDVNGQRTGTATRYVSTGLGYQHWFSPQVEVRPEFVWYHSIDAAAFGGVPSYSQARRSATTISCRATSSGTSSPGSGRGLTAAFPKETRRSIFGGFFFAAMNMRARELGAQRIGKPPVECNNLATLAANFTLPARTSAAKLAETPHKSLKNKT